MMLHVFSLFLGINFELKKLMLNISKIYAIAKQNVILIK
jgi:hypothetical protein